MTGEHPTDKIDHELPDSINITLGGEALKVLRTEADITGRDLLQIVGEAIVVRHFLAEQIAEGQTFTMTNPPGEREALTWNFGKPGEGRDLNPLSDR